MKKFLHIFEKHKEIILYVFFGFIAVILNICLFVLFYNVFCISVLVSNLICWLVCVTFQFFTNKIWVFNNGNVNKNNLIKQIILFFLGRVFTLILEDLIIFIFIELLMYNPIFIKTLTQFIIIVLNYVISRWFVFRPEWYLWAIKFW